MKMLVKESQRLAFFLYYGIIMYSGGSYEKEISNRMYNNNFIYYSCAILL